MSRSTYPYNAQDGRGPYRLAPSAAECRIYESDEQMQQDDASEHASTTDVGTAGVAVEEDSVIEMPAANLSSPPPGTESASEIGLSRLALYQQFQASITTVRSKSPLPAIKAMYESVPSLTQKQACMRYLLQYQHYNAAYSPDELRRLGYARPLLGLQKLPGYFRTNHYDFLKVQKERWVEKVLKSHYEDSYVQKSGKTMADKVNYASLTAVPALKAIYQNLNLVEFDSFFAKADWKTKCLASVVILRLTKEDLKTALESFIQEKLKMLEGDASSITIKDIYKAKDLKFLFVFEANPQVWVYWGGQIFSSKKQKGIECVELAKIFDKGIYAHFNQAGLVPDRLAINHLLVSELCTGESFESDLKALEIGLSKGNNKLPSIDEAVGCWNSFINSIKVWDLSHDNALSLYRDVVVHWHDKFFSQHEELLQFSCLLLLTQVLSWVDQKSGLVQWAKAYQNLSEIVLLCFDVYSEKFKDPNYSSLILEQLDPKGSFAIKNAHLYSYAMEAEVSVLSSLFNQGYSEQRVLSIACLNQNYFEIVHLIRSVGSRRHRLDPYDSLAQIEDMPDVLIADIHPNNAARERLFQNDVAGWVVAKLREHSDRHLALVLDFTLNNLTDLIVEETLSKLAPFVKEGRLQIFGIQSLAKLVQFGADNFSGGSCFYLGNSRLESPLIPSSPVSCKSALFSFLMINFQSLTSRYFKIIRDNTDYVYQNLMSRLSDVAAYFQINLIEADGHKVEPFCATEVLANTDEGSVYVAISFEPFFKLFDIEDRGRFTKKFRELILKMAEHRFLPITGRQSFGFSLSNVSEVMHNLRFSIGVENRRLLSQYLDLLETFSYLLSEFSIDFYNSQNPISEEFPRAFENFSNSLLEVAGLISKGGRSTPILADLRVLEEAVDEEGDDYNCECGNAILYYEDHQLKLTIQSPSEVEGNSLTVNSCEPKIGIVEAAKLPNGEWPYDTLFLLIYNVLTGKTDSIYIMNDEIGGFLRSRSLFSWGESFTKNIGSGYKLHFGSEFFLESPDGRWSGNQIYVLNPEGEDNIPLKINKLTSKDKDVIFTKFIHYELLISAYPNVSNSIMIKFGTIKPSCDYKQEMRKRWVRGKWAAIVAYLNGLDVNYLPLSHNQSWHKDSPTAMGELNKWVEAIALLPNNFFEEVGITRIKEIAHRSFKSAALTGFCTALFEVSLENQEGLQVRNVSQLAEFLADTELRDFLPSYGYQLDDWVEKVDRLLERNPDAVAHLEPYLRIVFPLMRYCYSSPVRLTSNTIHPLCNIAQRIRESVPEWANHLEALEQSLPTHVETTMHKHSNNIHAHIKYITWYLDVYLHYPLKPEVARQFVMKLQEIPEEKLQYWMRFPDFYYESLDKFSIRQFAEPREDLIISDAQSESLRRFLEETGCKQLLLMNLNNENPGSYLRTAVKWAIMTHDEDLFSIIAALCQSGNIDEETLKELEYYLPHLDGEQSDQAQLTAYVNRALSKASETASPRSVAEEGAASLLKHSGLFAITLGLDEDEGSILQNHALAHQP